MSARFPFILPEYANMANTLTALAPVAYSAAKQVAAEPFGLIDAISTSFDDKGVSIGDTIKVPVAPTRSASDYTPAMTVTAGTDATATSTDVTIAANKMVSWNITGEQLRSLENAQADNTWFEQLLMQGMRTLRNAAETAACATSASCRMPIRPAPTLNAARATSCRRWVSTSANRRLFRPRPRAPLPAPPPTTLAMLSAPPRSPSPRRALARSLLAT